MTPGRLRRTLLRMANRRKRREFKDAVREDRIKMGLSQVECARRMKVALRSLQEWEAGRTEPILDKYELVADFFGWDVPVGANRAAIGYFAHNLITLRERALNAANSRRKRSEAA